MHPPDQLEALLAEHGFDRMQRGYLADLCRNEQSPQKNRLCCNRATVDSLVIFARIFSGDRESRTWHRRSPLGHSRLNRPTPPANRCPLWSERYRIVEGMQNDAKGQKATFVYTFVMRRQASTTPVRLKPIPERDSAMMTPERAQGCDTSGGNSSLCRTRNHASV